MTGLVFHKDTELILAKKQKEILCHINSTLSTSVTEQVPAVIMKLPLICILENSSFKEKSTSELKKIIKSVQIHGACIKENSLCFCVKIVVSDFSGEQKEITEFVPFGTFWKDSSLTTQKEPNFLEKVLSYIESENNNFCLKCTVFRAAQIQKEGYVTKIIAPIWIKCRKA